MPADDLTDPAPATTFAHLDATTVLSRAIAELGIYPAVDPLDSTSRIMDPNIIGPEHYNIARNVQKILQDYKSLQVYTLANKKLLFIRKRSYQLIFLSYTALFCFGVGYHCHLGYGRVV